MSEPATEREGRLDPGCSALRVSLQIARKCAWRYAGNLLATFTFSALGCGAAFANPQGPQVVQGQVAFSRPNANTLNITNSRNAIINWQAFSIGKNETTGFVQPDASSAILNRVTGQDPSAILGQLLSNGRVFLINRNGMVFGPDAKIDTAGFIASTLNITDKDFLAGKLTFEGGADAGTIKNQGLIQARHDGGVYLIAPRIENSGIIRTEGGNLLLAAGHKLTISSLDVDHISFEIQAPGNEVVNLGKLLTGGGAMGLFAGTIRNHGVIEAQGVAVDKQGNIKLVARGDIGIEPNSQISASGSAGGNVHIESEIGTTRMAGSIEARGVEGRGGEVHILGEQVELADKARIDVSGERGGGTALVGGDFQGRGEVKNAKVTHVGLDASIKADAVREGDGGKVIVWADEKTRFRGNVTARGGSERGNGGFVEVSSREFLDYGGNVDTLAPHGTPGTLLLDPTNIVVLDNACCAGLVDVDQFDDPDELPSVATTRINSSLIDNAQTNVTLQARNNITFGAPINILTPGVGLTAQANNNIAVDATANIITNGGDLTFRADFDNDGVGGIGIGNIPGRTAIRTNGGDFTAFGRGLSDGIFGIIISNTDIDAGGGNITLTGTGSAGFFSSRGIVFRGSPIVETRGAGAITLDGTSVNGTDSTHGILIEEAGGRISAVDGNVRLTGTASGTGVGNLGIELNNFLLETAGTGTIELRGTGGSGTEDNHGITISGSSRVSAVNGTIILTGSARGSDENAGTSIFNNTPIQSGAAIHTNGSIQTNGNDLTLLAGSGAVDINGPITTEGGNITLTGANVNIGAVALDVGNSAGKINLTPIAGTIGFQGSTLRTDNLTFGGPVSDTGSLTVLPATAGKTIDIGSADPLLSSDNIAMLGDFRGALSIGGSIAPPSTMTQARAGNIRVRSDFRVGGDLTLVSLGDISVEQGGSIGSDGTLTLAALGQPTGTGTGDIKDPGPADFFFNAPTIVFFANDEAGTLANPLTVRSGSNTVHVGAGAGVAFLDGAPRNIAASSQPIRDIFGSFQSAGLNLDPDILNTTVGDVSVVTRQPLPPEFFPTPQLAVSLKHEGSLNPMVLWNRAVTHSAKFEEWVETGPQVFRGPFETVIETFVARNSWVVVTVTMDSPGVFFADVFLYSDGSIESESSVSFDLSAGRHELSFPIESTEVPVGRLREWWRERFPFYSRDGRAHMLYFRGQGPDAELVIESKPQAFQTFLNERPANRDKQEAQRLYDELRATQRSAGRAIAPADPGAAAEAEFARQRIVDLVKRLAQLAGRLMDVDGDVAPPPKRGEKRYPWARVKFGAEDTEGKPMKGEVGPVSMNPVGARLINPVDFGPPDLIRPREATQYSFFSLSEFDSLRVYFWRDVDRTLASENSLPAGARPGTWTGGQWDGLGSQGQPSYGPHRVEIKAWNRGANVESVPSDSTVTVSE